LTQGLRHYFTLCARFGPSWPVFGEDDTISRNKETINNPAITAPINIGDPISASTLYFSLSTLSTNHEYVTSDAHGCPRDAKHLRLK
jgi:hypothetical protein